MQMVRVAHVWGERVLDVRVCAAGAAMRMPADDELGQTRLVVTRVEVVRGVEAPSRDWHFAKWVACAVLVAGAGVTMMSMTAGWGYGEDDSMARLRTSAVFVRAEPPPVVVTKLVEKISGAKTLFAPAAAASVARPRAKSSAASVLGQMFAGPSQVFAPGMGAGLNDALNRLSNGAPSADAAGGLAGMASRGTGPGGPGGGLSMGSLGIPGGRPGGLGVGLSGHQSIGPDHGPDRVIGDGLDKEVVAKVIRRHLSEVKYCYESQLTQKPSLAGKLSVLFTIDPTGAVSDANVAESGLDDASVEGCILARVRRWKFPQPRGGGVVSISYPWIFRPAGSDTDD